jgi:4-hydroxyacetophenone monooxygenase
MTTTTQPLDLPGGDREIRAALDEANVPALLMVLVHLSGDEAHLDGPFRPARLADVDHEEGDVLSLDHEGAVFGEGPHGLPEALQRELRDQVFALLKTYRDEGRALPPPPSNALLAKMMDACMGERVPDEYVPLFREEMDLDDISRGAIAWSAAPSAETLARHSVIIIGAGISGMCTAIKLREAGIPFVVIEKNETVGGTWWENTYPGCGVDTPNHFYSYSFEPNHDWSGYFSKRDELHAYLERCSRQYGVREAIRFNTSVVRAEYDSASQSWRVRVRERAGSEETLEARFLISGTGQLNRPKRPEIPGADRFAGPNFHSAEWEHQHDLQGKKVAVIGTGASAMQFVPPVAEKAERVTIFQRSPQWAFHVADYHRSVSEGKKWLLKHVPYYAKWYRFGLFWNFSDKSYPAMRRDPAWGNPDTSMNEASDAIRTLLTAHIKEVIGDDPELLAKVIPSYPPFGKRMLLDNHWFRTLKRDNVDLVTEPIREITEDALVTQDGATHEVDAIVYATGFYTNRYLYPMEIVGKKGVALSEHWGEDPRAYLGLTVPDFPNLFLLYGPNTNLSHGGSIIFHTECQVRYIVACLKLMIEADKNTFECRQEVHDRYNELVDGMHAEMVWAHKGVKSWYQNADGRVTSVSPFRLVDYWEMTQAPDPEDFVID